MNYIKMILPIIVVLLASCAYDAPLTTEHSININPDLLGLWELESGLNSEDDPEESEQILILRYSDTEYFINYFEGGGEDEIYFRGYPIKVGDILCVQLEFIGSNEGTPDDLEEGLKTLFHVASYLFINDQLEIRFLNTDLVSDDLKTTEEIRRAFLDHKDDEELFIDPGVFRKIEN